MQDLVPAHHDPAVPLDDLLQPLVEVRLEIMPILEMMLAFELTDLLVPRPRLAVHLIAADVEVLDGKRARHLPDESIEEVIGVVARRVHRGIMYAQLARNVIGPGMAGELGVGHEPAGGVAGNIKLRNYADTAIASVGDHILNLLLRVIQAIGG